MAEINPCNWLQNAGETHTAAQMRVGIGALLGGASTNTSLNGRGAVNPSLGGGMQVTQTGSGFGQMSVNVASGVAYVAGDLASAQGTYTCINDGIVTRAIQSSDGSNDRIDAVIARVRDSFYSGAQNSWTIEVITGTAESEPEVPDLPDNSLLLAEVLVEAGTNSIFNSDITDRRPFMPVGVIPVMDDAERDALINPYSGMPVWVIGENALDVWDGDRFVSLTRGPIRIIFTSNGTFNKTNYPWARKVYVQVQAGGGGGAGSAATGENLSVGSGGGAGGYAERIFDWDVLPNSVSVIIGSGGIGAPAGDNDGSAGGNSQFHTILCNGGSRGVTSGLGTGDLNVPGGIGGSAAGGDINIAGGDGGLAKRSPVDPGYGGASFLSGSVRATSNQSGENRTGLPGKLYGGGGGGAYSVSTDDAHAGGNGAAGIVIVTVF